MGAAALTPDLKLTRLILTQADYAIIEADQARFLNCFLSQDECWVHQSKPETKGHFVHRLPTKVRAINGKYYANLLKQLRKAISLNDPEH